jgi:L-fuculose-phosphate aldolase
VTTRAAAPALTPSQGVALVCRVLGGLGLTREPAGHVSVRLDGGRVAIKSRGEGEAGLRYTTESDIVTVDFDGNVVDGSGLRPPQELPIHLQILRARPDVMSVVHVHPTASVLATIAGIPIAPVVGAYDPYAIRLLAKGLPTFERSVLVNTPELGDELAAALGDASVCLMRGHGLTAVGATLEEAGLNAIKIDELIDLNLEGVMLGTARPISDDDLRVVVGDGTTRPALVASAWDYYVRQTSKGGDDE